MQRDRASKQAKCTRGFASPTFVNSLAALVIRERLVYLA